MSDARAAGAEGGRNARKRRTARPRGRGGIGKRSGLETGPGNCSGKKFLNNFCPRAPQFFHVRNWRVDAVLDGDYTSKINAGVAELADAADLKFASLRSVGSSPTTRTTHARCTP